MGSFQPLVAGAPYSAALVTVCHALLNKDPRKRPTCAAILNSSEAAPWLHMIPEPVRLPLPALDAVPSECQEERRESHCEQPLSTSNAAGCMISSLPALLSSTSQSSQRAVACQSQSIEVLLHCSTASASRCHVGLTLAGYYRRLQALPPCRQQPPVPGPTPSCCRPSTCRATYDCCHSVCPSRSMMMSAEDWQQPGSRR